MIQEFFRVLPPCTLTNFFAFFFCYRSHLFENTEAAMMCSVSVCSVVSSYPKSAIVCLKDLHITGALVLHGVDALHGLLDLAHLGELLAHLEVYFEGLGKLLGPVVRLGKADEHLGVFRLFPGKFVPYAKSFELTASQILVRTLPRHCLVPVLLWHLRRGDERGGCFCGLLNIPREAVKIG